MSEFVFKSFLPTPGEKHLGIAEIKLWNKIVVRYKIFRTKDKNNIFLATPSYKINDNGTERYINGFSLIDNSEKEDVDSIVLANVKKILGEETTLF